MCMRTNHSFVVRMTPELRQGLRRRRSQVHENRACQVSCIQIMHPRSEHITWAAPKTPDDERSK